MLSVSMPAYNIHSDITSATKLSHILILFSVHSQCDRTTRRIERAAFELLADQNYTANGVLIERV